MKQKVKIGTQRQCSSQFKDSGQSGRVIFKMVWARPY